MPDYAKLLPRTPLANATSLGGRLWEQPQEKFIAGLRGSMAQPGTVSREYYPTETAGKRDLKAISIAGPYVRSIEDLVQSPEDAALGIPMKFPFEDVDELANYDYETGKMVAKNQYLSDMKEVNLLPPGSPQHTTLSEIATRKYQSETNKLEMKLGRWENTERTINNNPNYDNRIRHALKMKFYDRNRIFQGERLKVDTGQQTFNEGYIQRTLGELATNTVDIYDRETAISYAAQRLGPDFAKNYPEAMNIINQREKTNFETQFTPGTATTPMQDVTGNLAPSGTVKMLSPDFKQYEVPQDQIGEALRRGWKRI